MKTITQLYESKLNESKAINTKLLTLINKYPDVATLDTPSNVQGKLVYTKHSGCIGAVGHGTGNDRYLYPADQSLYKDLKLKDTEVVLLANTDRSIKTQGIHHKYMVKIDFATGRLFYLANDSDIDIKFDLGRKTWYIRFYEPNL